MVGKYKIIVKNRRVVFQLNIERNITIIKGKSATGKTTLINVLRNYEDLKEKSGVTISSAKACHVLYGNDWQEKIAKWSDSFIFLDEGNEFIKSEDFAKAIKGTDNYYIIVTRENLYQLPYSVNSILELRKTTSRFKCTYNKTYPCYDKVEGFKERLKEFDDIITEDSNSGFDMFSAIANENNIKCISANGKSNIYFCIDNNNAEKILVIADGAAFGAEMEKIYNYYILHQDKVVLYLPESFEWLIMSSGIVTDKEIEAILKDTANYADTKKYLSWEQLFTKLLEDKTAGNFNQYHKKKLNKYYLQKENVDKIINKIEG